MKGYVSAEYVATLLGLDELDDNTLFQISLFIGLAEDAVDAYCEAPFEQELDSYIILEGSGTSMLSLPKYLTGTSFTVEELDKQGDSNGDITTTCELKPKAPRKGIYRWISKIQASDTMTPATFSRNANYKITGDWGFSPVPHSVQLAVALTVKHLWNIRQYDELTKNEYAFNRNAESGDVDGGIAILPRMAKLALNQYKLSKWVFPSL